MLCINCNSPRVTRDGDDFTCKQCGYTWDVAHEQANAAYLMAQGRTPAKSVAEPSEPNDLDTALGLVPPIGTDKLYEVPGDIEYAEEKVLSGPVTATDDDGTINVILREPHPLTADEADTVERVLNSKTVPEIEVIAEEAGIDLVDARLKADKVVALIKSGRVFLADDGVTVIVVDGEGDE